MRGLSSARPTRQEAGGYGKGEPIGRTDQGVCPGSDQNEHGLHENEAHRRQRDRMRRAGEQRGQICGKANHDKLQKGPGAPRPGQGLRRLLNSFELCAVYALIDNELSLYDQAKILADR